MTRKLEKENVLISISKTDATPGTSRISEHTQLENKRKTQRPAMEEKGTRKDHMFMAYFVPDMKPGRKRKRKEMLNLNLNMWNLVIKNRNPLKSDASTDTAFS